jgi:riboflavin kinase/FMN adenylyltransferase
MSPTVLDRAVITVGTFDGVHRGHRLVLQRLAERGRARGLESLLVTFTPHPLDVVRPESAPPHLTTAYEQERALRQCGIDRVEVLPFTPELAKFDAPRFVDEILRARFGMAELLVGYDHGFGRDRSGRADVLRALGEERGFAVTVVPPVQGRDGTPLSSTRIRQSVAAGDLAGAADGLGRPYSVISRVVPGDGRGRTLGFRTLNLDPVERRKLLPPEGVYAVTARIGGARYSAMMNLGPRPTFGDPTVQLEAHLFDAEGDWYGEEVELGFIRRLRETRKFDGREALMAQLRQDEEMARVSVARGIGLY